MLPRKPPNHPTRRPLHVTLAAFLATGSAAGCPAATSHPAPVVAPRAEQAPTRPAPRGLAAASPRPIGEPPYTVALLAAQTSVFGGAPLAPSETSSLRAALEELLRRSAMFTPTDDPGAAQSVVRVAVMRERSGQLTARAAIATRGDRGPADYQGAAADEATEVAVAGPTLRLLALQLASAIYRHHLDAPGPFATEIAFVAGTATEPRSRQVFVVGFDGRGLRRVSREGSLNIMPGWSPRGELAFTSYATGQPSLVVTDAAQRRSTHLAPQGGLNVGAAFSPDGMTIAMAASRDGNTDIYLVGRDGSLLRRVTRHRGIDVSPSWSPDGRHIAFISDRSGSPQVHVKDLDSAAPPRRLTFTGSYNQEPDWCPRRGSTAIAYTARHGGERYEIHLTDASGGPSRQLTHDGGSNKSPGWSTDCRLILFSSSRNGLWVVTTDGRRRAQIYTSAARSPAWSAPRETARP